MKIVVTSRTHSALITTVTSAQRAARTCYMAVKYTRRMVVHGAVQ